MLADIVKPSEKPTAAVNVEVLAPTIGLEVSTLSGWTGRSHLSVVSRAGNYILWVWSLILKS